MAISTNMALRVGAAEWRRRQRCVVSLRERALRIANDDKCKEVRTAIKTVNDLKAALAKAEANLAQVRDIQSDPNSWVDRYDVRLASISFAIRTCEHSDRLAYAKKIHDQMVALEREINSGRYEPDEDEIVS